MSVKVIGHAKLRFLLLLMISLALKFLSPDTDVPWCRVISSSGTISSRGPGTEGAARQRDALIAEGVEVTTGRTGEMRVDFRQWGWFPLVGSVELPDGAVVEERH